MLSNAEFWPLYDTVLIWQKKRHRKEYIDYEKAIECRVESCERSDEGLAESKHMAFGFPPSYCIELDLHGDRRSARDAVAYAFEILDWSYRTIDPDHFRAEVACGGSIWGWEEIFTVSLDEGKIKLRSASGFWILPQSDGGKNKKNVDRFILHFSHKESRDSKTKISEPDHLDEAGNTPLERLLSQDAETS